MVEGGQPPASDARCRMLIYTSKVFSKADLPSNKQHSSYICFKPNEYTDEQR